MRGRVLQRVWILEIPRPSVPSVPSVLSVSTTQIQTQSYVLYSSAYTSYTTLGSLPSRCATSDNPSPRSVL